MKKYRCINDAGWDCFTKGRIYTTDFDGGGLLIDDYGNVSERALSDYPMDFQLVVDGAEGVIIKHGDWLLFNSHMGKPVVGIVLHIAGDYAYTTEGPCNFQDVLERR